MFFVGIITNQKNEAYIKKELLKIGIEKNVIFINEKNITNVKNVKFETLIIDDKVENKTQLRKIIEGAKYIILNSDIPIDLELMDNLNLTVITYGFNNKATFTVSSIEENNIIICLQRIIYNKNNEVVEPQEFKLEVPENLEKHIAIFIYIIKILYSKIK